MARRKAKPGFNLQGQHEAGQVCDFAENLASNARLAKDILAHLETVTDDAERTTRLQHVFDVLRWMRDQCIYIHGQVNRIDQLLCEAYPYGPDQSDPREPGGPEAK